MLMVFPHLTLQPSFVSSHIFYSRAFLEVTQAQYFFGTRLGDDSDITQPAAL